MYDKDWVLFSLLFLHLKIRRKIQLNIFSDFSLALWIRTCVWECVYERVCESVCICVFVCTSWGRDEGEEEKGCLFGPEEAFEQCGS
jgi:hypothetical protein